MVRLCGPPHIKPAAVRYIFLCITPVDSSKYPTAWDWWRENHHLYPTSHVLRNATCLRRQHPLLVSVCTARRYTCSQTDLTGWVQKKADMLGLEVAYLCTKFADCSLSHSRDMVGAHQHLSGSHDLTTSLSGMVLSLIHI